MISLFDPLRLGEIYLPNRIVMAPMTRARAGAKRVPNPLMAEYYQQRATAGLIISEAVSVCPQGVGYADTPGIWSQEQVDGWQKITRAVHEAGGRIALQLWHVGRVSHPVFLQGDPPVAPSAIAPAGYVSMIQPKTAYCQPRALGIGEIAAIVQAFQRGAENAQKAGFDGVEVHGANGYLLDQFLQDGSNRRNDAYGGSIENRARLLLEVVDAVVSVWGAGRVGVHLAPRCDAHSMGDSNPKATFGYVAQELAERRIAFLCARESQDEPRLGPHLKALFKGPYIVNQGLSFASAQELLSQGQADAAAFGKAYIANPDLVQRFYALMPLNKPDPARFYVGGAKGYIDYPALGDDLS